MEDFEINKNGSRDVIDTNEVENLRAWADKLDVTKAKLKAAVNAVGNSPKDVALYLQKNNKK